MLTEAALITPASSVYECVSVSVYHIHDFMDKTHYYITIKQLTSANRLTWVTSAAVL